ncbi:GGDEF domain-containing protein [Salinimonas sp. HHU 13199]|uniref:diguanylate cyclase n=1 Tax=Salinimonas profundi TaxID=2729140 RepID=A0ABR8LJS1_9ALTE|nr:GGDEF domain-containing protein [Salinimonas profundi]MBD3585523.1 GGDEF domain-containing protein [Salinimonas profundi]
MEEAILITILTAMVGAFALIGIVFSYALPSPSQPDKASAAYYARLFLFFLWLGFVFLCLRALEMQALHVAGCNISFTLAAYMVYFTVVKRHGNQPRPSHMAWIIGHLVTVQLLSVLAFWLATPFWFSDTLLAISVFIPQVLALRAKYRSMDRRNPGDRVLCHLLWVNIVVCMISIPVYLLDAVTSGAQQMLLAMNVVVILMLNVMLGFAASVIHSLVVRLRKQIYQDPLTKCHNRHYLQDYASTFVDTMQVHREKVCVLVTDVDHFKSINDRYGHLTGDNALNHFTYQLQQELRDSDVLIRWGGEEFLVVLPGCTIEDAAKLAERLRQRVALQPLVIDTHSIALTASFGLADVARDCDLFAAIDRADSALYDAKSSGRDKVVVFDPNYRTDKTMSMAFQ